MSKRGPNLKIIVAKKKEGVHVNTKSRSQNIHIQWISFRWQGEIEILSIFDYL